MKKAYIVLVHKTPQQVIRLIRALDDGNSLFFLHIDTKAEAAFKTFALPADKVVFIKSVATEWGRFSLVEATLHALHVIKEYNSNFDFISLISGQHYPIRSNKQINEFLSNTTCHAFLEHTTLPDYKRWKVRGGLYRIDRYFMGLRAYQRYTAKALNFLLPNLPVLRRKFPPLMKPYAGSQWWTIDNYAFQYLMDFLANDTDYYSFYKYTFAPDELFFHNIWLNAKDEKLRQGIANNNLLYMNWPDSDAGHPEILNTADLQGMMNSKALFARKFDIHQDADVLDTIDRYRADDSAANLPVTKNTDGSDKRLNSDCHQSR